MSKLINQCANALLNVDIDFWHKFIVPRVATLFLFFTNCLFLVIFLRLSIIWLLNPKQIHPNN